MSFHTSGDIPDLQSLHLKILDHSIAAVGVPAMLAFIQHQDLHDITRQHPGIAAALWRETLIDAAIFREWMVGLGRRAADQRFAHLVCEMALRMKAVGLADHQTYDFPVTQSDLGDALGLSTVHVNRVLQEIRKKGLLEFKGSRITIRDWKGLEELGQFDPIYLHQNSAAGMLDG
jgi:CRP-like cAMP-binding protein